VRCSRRGSFWISLPAILLASGCARVPQPGEPLSGLTRAQRAEFEAGQRSFARTFDAASGLGPLFNADACAECHEDPVVGGSGDEVELHASAGSADSRLHIVTAAHRPTVLQPFDPGAACDLLVESGGPVFQRQVTDALRAALGIDHEPLPAAADTAQRTSPDLFGFGLLDAVSDAEILRRADPEDANGDGISGRANHFADGRLGRFGRKAFVPTLAEFNAGAFPVEMGITVPEIPDEGTIGGLPIPPGVDPLPEPELDAAAVGATNAFVRFLAPPPYQRPRGAARTGERVFAQVRCDACHVPVLRTGRSDVRVLSHRRVRAYTDLLLHDMGPALADICMGEASPAEFRTEPLMGLRFASRFLHDGRAASLEEAVTMHAGEAAAARDAYLALPESRRRALLAFLAGL
jgi:CxxC motif-containing protein (DUF1111 family)